MVGSLTRPFSSGFFTQGSAVMTERKDYVTITIDGKTVEVPKTKTIIQVADDLGIFIPRYCYHPGLSIAANCRICMVKVENAPRLMTACSTYVQDGMVVDTRAEEVQDARKHVLEFLLLNHPVDCPVCDQAGECWLQDYYMAFGRYKKRYLEPRIRRQKAKPIGPYVILDQERCILCTRCIRFCNEVARSPQLGLFNRGHRTVVDIFPGQELNNDYSGNVVDVCPVGALLDRDFRFRARVWFLKRTRSICPGCSTGCNIYIDWCEDKPYLDRGRRVFRLKPRYNPEVNQYWMCDDGRYDYRWLDDNRIGQPYRRATNGPEPIDWQTALETIVSQLKDLQTRGALERAAVLLSPHLSTEELYLGWRLFHEKLGIMAVHYLMPSRSGKQDDFLIRPDKYPNARAAGILGIGADAPQPSEIVKQAADGAYDILWFIGWNPARCFDENLLQNVVTKTPLVILQTCNRNASFQYAHLILPASPYAEKNGTFINANNRLQRFERAVRPYKESRPDWVIFRDLALALGFDDLSFETEADIFQDMTRRHPVFAGLDFNALDPFGIPLPVSEEAIAAPAMPGQKESNPSSAGESS